MKELTRQQRYIVSVLRERGAPFVAAYAERTWGNGGDVYLDRRMDVRRGLVRAVERANAQAARREADDADLMHLVGGLRVQLQESLEKAVEVMAQAGTSPKEALDQCRLADMLDTDMQPVSWNIPEADGLQQAICLAVEAIGEMNDSFPLDGDPEHTAQVRDLIDDRIALLVLFEELQARRAQARAQEQEVEQSDDKR